MKEGLEFLTPEHGIMEYGYDPFYEEEPDFLAHVPQQADPGHL